MPTEKRQDWDSTLPESLLGYEWGPLQPAELGVGKHSATAHTETTTTHTHDGTASNTTIVGGVAEAGATAPTGASAGSVVVGDEADDTQSAGDANPGAGNNVVIGYQAKGLTSDSEITDGPLRVVVIGATARARGQNLVSIGYDALAGPSAGAPPQTNAGDRDVGCIAIGYGTRAGNRTTQANNGAMAVGYTASALHAGSVALGMSASANAANAIAIGEQGGTGDGALATDAIAIGRAALANGAQGVAVGVDANATAVDTVALGNSPDATAEGAVAIGRAAQATHTDSVALGDGSVTTAADQLAIPAMHIELTEITAPAAGATNSARLFVEDNGSGKTRLMVQFATGAAQQIAIEP